MLVRLLTPTEGRIVFHGQDITQPRRRDRRDLCRRIQIVFQDPYSSLDPRMRVSSVIAEGLYHSKLGRQAEKTRIDELLDVVGLPGRVGQVYPHQLSGGERQRVGIARALASDPELLIADEPVSALDASVQGQVLNLLRDLQATRNLAMIFVAHELPVARYMSDWIAVMHMGRLIEFGRADELFDHPAHPYTQALLAAMPSYGQQRAERTTLPGDTSADLDTHPHCRFSRRCPRALDRCQAEDPVLRPEISPEHSIACFNWTTAAAGSAA
jgi:oligopeptide/dipeptide ABC transporter ATP-binding protein